MYDNAKDQHNRYMLALAQLLVDVGLVDRVLVYFLPAHHAKDKADM